ncbi:hypothetical protein AVEN_197036-1 [Araneus ventricosus]|uniref:Uncharacterized protein n=1 Tax=Araneus ventricosus TaxID=182803 RepID=A0A4Y2GG12_ARAVE|nr:hypothetical protein AVEN_197036-1 [Araneus ventricosus]
MRAGEENPDETAINIRSCGPREDCGLLPSPATRREITPHESSHVVESGVQYCASTSGSSRTARCTVKHLCFGITTWIEDFENFAVTRLASLATRLASVRELFDSSIHSPDEYKAGL